MTMSSGEKRKIIVAITGASGAVYAQLLMRKLQNLGQPPEEIAVILSETAREIWAEETGEAFSVSGGAKEYSNDTFFAPFASGSSTYDTMIICPASMGTIGRIANGVSDSLITRTADVMLKEGRKLIVIPREAPYSLIHLNNMKKLVKAGAVVCPASPSFYSKPQTIEELVMTIVDRIIDQAGFKNNTYRWQGR